MLEWINVNAKDTRRVPTSGGLPQRACSNSFHSMEEWPWTGLLRWKCSFASSIRGRFRRRRVSFASASPPYPRPWRRLEERLGTRLLLRSSRGLATTEAGQNFYDRARRAIEKADEADLAARGAGAGLVGPLRFSAAVTFARLHVIPHLPAFLARHPGLTIEAVLDDRNVDPVEEGIDVTLRMGTLADSTLVARKIGESRRLVVGTPAYFAAAGKPATPDDLSRHRGVIYARDGGGNHFTFRNGAAAIAVTLDDRLRITAAEGVREAVLAGLGVAVISEWMFERELSSGVVHEVLNDWTLPPTALWALFPTGRRASAKARAFVDFVETILTTNQPGDRTKRERKPTMLAFPPSAGQYSSREVGGGRATRQPGQIRKEAALTSAVRVARQPPTLSYRLM